MIEIREVKTRKEIKQFIDFPLRLYKGNPYFVPPLYSSEKALFKKVTPYSSACDTVYFNAYKNGEIVGRISGIIQRDANEKWHQKNVRFTRFDTINDYEVAKALFDKVAEWGKQKGMDTIQGPLSFNDLEREGLLVDGFDKLSTFEEQYNYPYYVDFIEKYGFECDAEWIEQELRLPKEKDENLIRVRDAIFNRLHLHIATEKSSSAFINRYRDDFFKLLDDTYSELYATCPMRKEVQDELVKGFKLLLRSDNIIAIYNDKNEMVAFSLYFSSIAKAVQKSNGKLTPAGIVRVLHAINNPDVLDLGLIGVRKDYVNYGLPVAMVIVLYDLLETGKYDHLETNLTLVDNAPVLNLLRRFDGVIHKRRRSYKKKID